MRSGIWTCSPTDPFALPSAESLKLKIAVSSGVQLTFHGGDTAVIGGVDCVMVEPDIDYCRDLAAHTIYETSHPPPISSGLFAKIRRRIFTEVVGPDS